MDKVFNHHRSIEHYLIVKNEEILTKRTLISII